MNEWKARQKRFKMTGVLGFCIVNGLIGPPKFNVAVHAFGFWLTGQAAAYRGVSPRLPYYAVCPAHLTFQCGVFFRAGSLTSGQVIRH